MVHSTVKYFTFIYMIKTSSYYVSIYSLYYVYFRLSKISMEVDHDVCAIAF